MRRSVTLEDLNGFDRETLERLLVGSPEEVASVLAIAAEGGAVDAQLALGQALLDGRGVPADDGAAVRWFVRAAEAGHPMGMNMLGRCYEHGWGVSTNKPRAAEWFRAAAARDLDWGLYNLATLLTLGEGVAQNRAQALTLFRRVAARGHVKSLNMIGSFYEDGWVVTRDMSIAAGYFRRAAEGGDFRGMFNHTRMLLADDRREEAVAWLRHLSGCATPAFLEKARGWLADRHSDCVDALAD